MHQPEVGTRIYSHTSLALWRLCHRRWYQRYLAPGRQREPQGETAAFSAVLVHEALSLHFSNQPIDWAALEAKFQGMVDGKYDPSLHSVGSGQRILAAICATPPPVENAVPEAEIVYDFGTARYSTRPDLVGWFQGRRATVDFKYTEAKWRGKEPWPIRPLLPYDDQLLGQAILSEAGTFIRCTIRRNPASHVLADPVYEERMVDSALREEWLAETSGTIADIEKRIANGGPWEKNDDACDAYRRECIFKPYCKRGLALDAYSWGK